MSLEDELRQAEAQNDRLNAALEVEVRTRRSLAESLAVAYVELEETRKKLMLARHQWTEAESGMIRLRERLALLEEAVGYGAKLFEQDEPVEAADLVEWFAEWRGRAKASLSRLKEVQP